MSSTKKTYNLSKIKQLIDLNGDSTNFDIQFRVTSKNGAPFDILVVDQTTLDNSPELQYKNAKGQMAGSMVQDKNVYQNYFIVLRADPPCECDVEIIKKELPKTREQIPQIPQGPPQPQPGNGVPQMPSSPQPRKMPGSQSNWKTWAIIGVIVVGAIILYMVYASDKKKSAEAAPVQSAKMSASSPTKNPSPSPSHHTTSVESPSPVSQSPASRSGGYGGNSLMNRLKRLHMN
jgi:hypothetical protein